MADAVYSRRDFAGGAVVTTLSGSINASDTSIPITLATGWPSGTNGEFFVVINKGASTEEKVRIDTRSGTTLTVTSSGRGVDGTSAASHSSGESIQLCTTATDLDEANKAVAETVNRVTTAGDLLVGSGANAMSRLAVGASGRMLVSTGSAPAWVAMSGDATINSSGVITVANDAITAAKIATDAVGTAEIAADAVTSSEIAAGAVAAAELASDAVTTAKILDANVTTAKIADSAVTSAKIADGTIAAGDLASDAVTTAKILDANVTAAKLAEAARPRWCIPGFSRLATGSGAAFNRVVSNSGGGTISGEAIGVTMFEAGSVVGITIHANAARTGGSYSAEVYLNDIATGLAVVLDGTHTTTHYAAQAAGLDTFVAGDVLKVVGTTSSYTPAATLLEAVIWCQTT